MLTVKNLTKIYQPKKGLPVTALDNVSLTFPDNGMVFLLGKSGSGKSTLLNLIGGLDDYTSGEIIIKGKSCNDFKQSDYNSYRNTFIGFIFQEFNVLEEYNVGKNISLALEIQDKTAPKEAVESVMEIVDLDKSYFERKISELSGGQKQRVAIARALIKNPDIILADEPTGALDSATGKQVLETLKRVSKEKLVIVVSHDRDNAVTYGDRIIELADGKIISDRITASILDTPPESIKEYVDDGLALKKIRLPLKMAIKMGLSALTVKRARLAFSIILSVIAFIAFGLSWTASAYDLNAAEMKTLIKNGENTVLIKSFVEGGNSLLTPITKDRGSGFTPEEIAEIERITGNKTLKVYEQKEAYENITYSFSDSLAKNPKSIYYTDHLSGFLEVPAESDANLIAAAAGSRLPEKGNINEIAISNYVADSFVELGLIYNNYRKYISGYEDLLGEKIALKRSDFGFYKPHEMTIVGVYKTDVNNENYYSLKEKANANSLDMSFLSAMENMIITMGYVTENFRFPKLSADLDADNLTFPDWTFKMSGAAERTFYLSTHSILESSNYIYFGKNISELAEDEIVLSKYILDPSDSINIEELLDELGDDKKITIYHDLVKVGEYKVAGIYSRTAQEILYLSDTLYNLFLEKNNSDEYSLKINSGLYVCAPENSAKYFSINKILKASAYDLSKMNIYWGESGIPKTTLADNEIILNANCFVDYSNLQGNLDFIKAFDESEKNVKFGKYLWNTLGNQPFIQIVNGVELKVVGILFDIDFTNSIFSDNAFNAAVNIISKPFKILIKLSDSQKKNNELLKFLSSENDVGNGLYSTVRFFSSSNVLLENAYFYLKLFRRTLLYVSLGISIFAGLLLMNFIGVSIVNKKKEIGVLRAIGASGKDVFKVFLSEGLFIGLINFVISYVVLIILSVVINHKATITILMPGIIEAALMLALSIVVVVLATLAPILKIARKKPIDAINNR